ncbi:MAG TPA: aspartate dehydrogenase domain-containing protein [Vineibacter sp.]|nr:aspartate dehydrogenase domain-containing protein [Vineibacter sp.]
MSAVTLMGLGRIGGVVAHALETGAVPGLTLTGRVRRATPEAERRAALEAADIVVEAAMPDVVPGLAQAVLPRGKTLVVTSVAGLWLVPNFDRLGGRVVVPSGATLALDALKALALHGEPQLRARLLLPVSHATGEVGDFQGMAREAAKRFPAHVNNFVAAALALGLDDFPVEIRRDASVEGPVVELSAETATATLSARLAHRPSAAHPEVSRNIALSVLAALRGLVQPVRIGT